MTGATIDVQRPPAGWSHLQGPLLHVLVALPESDPRYARAVAAAVSGDLDDVLDVLAAEGMRRTPAFVAVAGASRPRVVTHADGYAVLTSSRGTLEVRAHHGRVWSDLVADEDVDTVALRVSPTWTPPAAPAETVAATSGLAATPEPFGPPEGHISPTQPAPDPDAAPASRSNPDMFELLPDISDSARNNPNMSESRAVELHQPSRTPAVEPPPDAGTDLIAAVPWRHPVAEEAEPAPQPEPAPEPAPATAQTPDPEPPENPNRDPGDTDATVDRAALLAAKTAETAPPPTGPTVLAVLCTRGHLNPPTSPTCRICGSVVPEQQAYETPRPPLGLLRLSTGDVVRLDRGVIMGRAPQAPPGLPPDLQPHVVRIASPQRDLSRNHVQVVVEGWQVILRDLDTTNGTTVTPPQGTTTRLRAGDPMVLEPGTVVSMADEVSFTYEVAAE